MVYANADETAPRASSALAALARIGQHFGLTLDPEAMARSVPFDGPEPSVPILLRMAERTGLTAKTIKVQRGELGRLADVGPALLMMPDGKTVLLETVDTRDGVVFALLNDPMAPAGVSALVDEHRLFTLWTGEAVLFKRRMGITDEDRPFGPVWLIGQILRDKTLMRDVAIAAFMLSLLSLTPFLVVMVLIDRVLDARSFDTLYILAGGVMLITVFDTGFGFLRRQLVGVFSSRIDARINIFVFDRLLNLPMAFFERVPTGMINAKVGQVWHIRHFLTGQIFGTLLDCTTLFVLLPFLFYLNWELACGVLLIAFAILGVYAAFLPSLRRAHAKVTVAEQRMGSHQVESIHGIRTIKSLSLEGAKRKERDLNVAESFKAQRDFEFLANWPQTIVRPLEMFIYLGSFLGGAYMVMTQPEGSATYGHVMAFAMIASRVAAPIVQLAGMLNAFEESRGAIAEVATVVNVPPEEGRSGSGLKQPIAGRIAFQNVRFKYSVGAPYALDGVSFEIPKDSIFGLMGRSGSGKTTVTRLLQGLNREYEGQIKIDRMDLREIDLDHLRSNIGVVPQENFLFRGTIRENICAARPNASLDQIIRAAQLAGAEEFIERMPQGYQTYIEEGASNLSGGQRQRLAIARALLIDPPILILDEATSALDAESEAIVNANLLRIAKGRTVVIVSHRLSALAMADSILVLEQGHFYDMGSHEDLLDRCDIYKSLWYQQNRHILETRNDRIALRSPPAA